MEVKIDGEIAQQIVQKAIFESLTEESRNAMIEQAIAALITLPPKVNYGSIQPPSPLQVAFNDQVRQVASEVVNTYLNDDRIRDSIRYQIISALDDLIKQKGNYLYDQIGYAVGQKIASVMGEED